MVWAAFVGGAFMAAAFMPRIARGWNVGRICWTLDAVYLMDASSGLAGAGATSRALSRAARLASAAALYFPNEDEAPDAPCVAVKTALL